MSVKDGVRRILGKAHLFTVACAGAVALSASLPANAAFVFSGGSTQPLPISGNDFNSDLQGMGYNQMTTGTQLRVDQDGFVTFYYIAAESAYTNSFHSGSDSITENNDSFDFGGHGNEVTIKVSAGEVLDFSFKSASSHALTPVNNAANNTNLSGLGIINDSGINGDGMSELVLAYNDNITLTAPGDADYDDMLVRAEFSAVPVPAAVWLFGSGLLGLMGAAARRKA